MKETVIKSNTVFFYFKEDELSEASAGVAIRNITEIKKYRVDALGREVEVKSEKRKGL